MMSCDVLWCLMISYDVLWCLMMSYDVLLLGNSVALLIDPQKHPHVPWQHWQPPRNAEAPQPSATPRPIATPLVVVPLLPASPCRGPAKVSRLFEHDSAPSPHTAKSGNAGWMAFEWWCHESWLWINLNLGIILNNLEITWNNWVVWPLPLLCVFSPDVPSLAWASHDQLVFNVRVSIWHDQSVLTLTCWNDWNGINSEWMSTQCQRPWFSRFGLNPQFHTDPTLVWLPAA